MMGSVEYMVTLERFSSTSIGRTSTSNEEIVVFVFLNKFVGYHGSSFFDNSFDFISQKFFLNKGSKISWSSYKSHFYCMHCIYFDIEKTYSFACFFSFHVILEQ